MRIPTHYITAGTLGILFLSPSLALAGGEAELLSQNPALLDARVLALGGGGVALRTGFASTWFNPAALAFEKRISFSASLRRDEHTNDTQRSQRNAADDWMYADIQSNEKNLVRLDQVGAVFPIPVYRGGMAFSIGYTTLRTFDGRQSYPEGDWHVGHNDEGSLTALLIGLGAQLTPTLSGGLTIVSYGGDHSHLLRESSSGGESLYLHDNLTFSGAALRLGLMLQPIDKPLQIGLRLALPSKIKVEWEQSGFEYIDEGEEYLTRYDYLSSNGYDVKLPLEFAVGAAWQERFWLVSAEAAWIDWSQAGYDDLPNGWSQVYNEDEIERGFGETWRFSIGGELLVPNTDLILRAGAWTHELPHTDAFIPSEDAIGTFDTWNVQLPSDRTGVSFGAAYLFSETISLSLSGSVEERELDRLLWQDNNGAVRLREKIEDRSLRLSLDMSF
jgi:hypothetical protein